MIMTKKLPSTLMRVLALGLLLTPSLAQAHPGHASGLSEGLAHPVSGLDHIAAMIGVGIWAAQLGGRARILVPVAFLAAMMLGSSLSIAGVPVSGVEQGIAASLFLLGLLLIAQCRLPIAIAMSLAAAFAVFHGLSHGGEMSSATQPLTYGLGFIVSTAVLHLSGLCLAILPSQINRPATIRLAGAALVICGVISLSLRL
jgi:urease accessory protein